MSLRAGIVSAASSESSCGCVARTALRVSSLSEASVAALRGFIGRNAPLWAQANVPAGTELTRTQQRDVRFGRLCKEWAAEDARPKTNGPGPEDTPPWPRGDSAALPATKTKSHPMPTNIQP